MVTIPYQNVLNEQAQPRKADSSPDYTKDSLPAIIYLFSVADRPLQALQRASQPRLIPCPLGAAPAVDKLIKKAINYS
jgi:hypothetical protein